MEVAQIFTCECSKRTYPSNQSLKAHRRTKMHHNWENGRELRILKKDMTIRDNTILKLEGRVDTLLDLNNELLTHIRELKQASSLP